MIFHIKSSFVTEEVDARPLFTFKLEQVSDSINEVAISIQSVSGKSRETRQEIDSVFVCISSFESVRGVLLGLS